MAVSPENRFDDGVDWLFRWSAVETVGTKTLRAAATRSALIAGSKRLAARAALLAIARRTPSSRVSRGVSAAPAAVAWDAAGGGWACAVEVGRTNPEISSVAVAAAVRVARFHRHSR